MYLKSLALHGFKSFPDKTVLQFHDGATVIVGPNGSGKSNITDAMRWVLGELSTKNIRGSKMEDVVFAGADGKKPMSFAEVSVTFDDSVEPHVLNAGYDEVTVTRRYYRSGDSEYAINNKKARLRDIYELFMNTGIGREGYSIIGQGKIAEIISKKSEERRSAFEESAGISKYRYKKSESEKKLAETMANMERIGDIERELEARVGPLEKDAARARRYLELYESKKKTDISLWLYDGQLTAAQIEKTEGDVKLSAHELEMAEDSRAQTEEKITRLYDQSHDNKAQSQKNYETLTEKSTRKSTLEGEVQVADTEMRHMEDRIRGEEIALQNAEAEIAKLDRERDTLQAQTGELADAAESGEREIAAMEGEQAQIRKNRQACHEESEMLFQKQKELDADNTDLRVRLNVLRQAVASQTERRQNIGTEIEKYRTQTEEAQSIVNRCEETIAQYREKLDEQTAAEENQTEKLRQIDAELESLTTDIRHLRGEREALDSRIQALRRMQEHFDGYNTSIRYVMQESKNGRLRGIHGPVSSLIKVDPRYVIAIETALGGALQNIITSDENDAKAAIAALKKANAGRATFYPITTIRPMERGREYDGMERFAGFVGYADALVESDTAYRNIIRSLLARCAVFTDLDHATIMAREKSWKVRAVTLDGQVINAGGSMTGGQAKRESGILTRSAQIDTWEAEKSRIDTALEAKNTAYKEHNAEKEKLLAADKNTAEAREMLQTLLHAEENHRSEAVAKRDFAKNLLTGLLSDSATLEETNQKSTGDIAALEKKAAALSAELLDIQNRRTALSAEEDEWEEKADAMQERLQGARIHAAEVARDLENSRSRLTEWCERIASRKAQIEKSQSGKEAATAEIDSLTAKKTETLTEIAALQTEIEALQKTAQELHDRGDALDSALTALQARLKEQTAKKDLVTTAHNKNENRLATLRTEYDKLVSKLWEEYELSYAAAGEYLAESGVKIVESGERSAAIAKQTTLRNEIRSLGHVNVAAIDEYAEVRSRYEYIKGQMDDLTAAKVELDSILAKMEKEMKTIFVDAFAKINQYFGEVFTELFGGGHAEVVLSDPEDPLNCGIEINAAPPGKTIKNLNLLSGGEQAFIAIALLFALIRVNPSPFCIFDEIEAALDEANVARVGRYVKKYTKEMQIIMISHRRGTMDIADTLYGVTMPQSGVSRVFTLDGSHDPDSLSLTAPDTRA